MRLHLHWVSKAFLLLLFCICVANHAYAIYDFRVDGIYYQKPSYTSTTVYVTYYITPSQSYSGDIVIPSNVTYNGTTYKVTGIGNSAFRDCPSLKSVEIPNTVTAIGGWAFYECTSLKSVNIPNSVKSIGEKAFYNCSSLEGDFTISNEVTVINVGTFYHCKKLKKVTIGNSVTTINGDAFNGCISLETINIPISVTNITGMNTNTWGAFRDCAPKKLIWDAKKCNSMGDMITSSIEQVSIGSSVEILPSLSGSQITHINIPSSVKSIKNGNFQDCSKLQGVSIPNSVTLIGNYAFKGCSSLSSINIPSSVTSIGKEAFKSCLQLNTAYISNNVTEFGEAAFSGCSSLSSVNIPTSLTNIGKEFFLNCSSLSNVTIPNSVTSIGEKAFCGCRNLLSLAIPASVSTIEDMAFANCPGLTSIKVNSGNSKFDSRNNCNAIIETGTNSLVTGCQNTFIPSTVTAIGKNAFRGCTTLTSIAIPNSVTSIGNYSFDNCQIKEIFIPESINYIPSYAFAYNDSLKNVVICNGSWGVADYAFYMSDNIKSIHIKKADYCIGSEQKSFSNNTYYSAKLYVPGNLLENYMNYYSWNKFRFFAEETGGFVDLNFNPSQQIGPTSAIIKAVYNGTTPVTDSFFKYNNEEYGDPAIITGLDPQKEYRVICGVETSNGKLITPRTFTTPALLMTAKAADMITNKDARLMAETNMADIETSCGFEWRRYDAPEEMPSAKVYCPVYGGVMAGTLKNMSENVYYKYRPFYKSSASNEYYGDWVAFITADAGVEFEPVVYTYNSPAVTQTEATMQGVALRGSEEITEQGFEYWKTGKTNMLTASGDVTRVTARGERMSKTVSGLQAGTRYTFRAYVTAGGETTYGQEVQFVTLASSLDVNLDGEINIADVNSVISLILENGVVTTGDVNNDGEVNIADINVLIDAILGM